MVVNVTTLRQREQVRQDGLTARRVEHSTAALTQVTSKLGDKVSKAGTALGGRPGEPTRS